MIEKQYIENLVKDLLETNKHLIEEGNKEIYLVDVTVKADNQIWVYLDSFQGITVEDCMSMNRWLEESLDREKEDFDLTVSSAGLDLPFKVLKQYFKNIGKGVEIITKDGLKHKAILKAANETEIEIEEEKKVKLEGAKRKTLVVETLRIPFEQIKSTKISFDF